jgi:NTE family protein
MNKLFSWARGDESAQPIPQKRVKFALQGGGAHGAFTWGVLDHLLEDGRLGIDGISGASAGAVNAVMLADGLVRGGPEEARKRLADFWRAASIDGSLPGFSRHFVDQLAAASVPMKTWLNSMGRFLSPSHMNPLNINPLKQLVERFVDFEALRNSDRELFISATNAQTGNLRLFTRDELTAEVVMASACLPLLFRPVRIDDVPYWDGGYVSNPPLLPFLQTRGSTDVLLVQIFPLRRDRAPTSSREIVGRTAEIAFNAPLLAELRGLAAVDRVAEQAASRLRLHRIVLDELTERPDPNSRLNNDYKFFQMLHQRGREAARRFLATHFDAIGSQSTMDAASESDPEYARQ